jgi:serine/threonine/tyrosine-interacting protein
MFRKAYSIVQQRRFCINPNDGFIGQLREYEPIYQAQKTLKYGQQASTNQRSKRTLHMTDNEHIDDRNDAMDS